MNFIEAVKIVMQGKKIRRKIWMSGCWIELQDNELMRFCRWSDLQETPFERFSVAVEVLLEDWEVLE